MIVPALVLGSLLGLPGAATAADSLDPIRLSMDEMKACWREVTTDLRAMNGAGAEARTEESLVAWFDGRRTELVADGVWVGPESPAGSARRLSYSFRSEGSPVSRVAWILQHEPRLLMVSGATPESAQRALEACTSRLAPHESPWGGDHAFGPIFLVIEGVLLVAAMGSLARGRRRLGVGLLFVLFLAPIPVASCQLAWVDRLLPGFRLAA